MNDYVCCGDSASGCCVLAGLLAWSMRSAEVMSFWAMSRRAEDSWVYSSGLKVAGRPLTL